VTCKEGGVEVKSGSAATAVCNGSPWSAGGTLPPGQTETGTFGYRSDLRESPGLTTNVPISFSIPLAASLSATQVHLLNIDGSVEFVMNETTEVGEEKTPTGCGTALTPPGTATNPTAAPGNLCVYLTKSAPNPLGHSASNLIVLPDVNCVIRACWEQEAVGAGVSGARFQVFNVTTVQATGWGTWALTAPES
jgi:hypothetical protein